MDFDTNFEKIHEYFENALQKFGTTAQGADWNSPKSQEVRFEQLIKVIEGWENFSILDYGCGYAALVDYLLIRGYRFNQFVGYDILDSMIDHARELHSGISSTFFTTQVEQIPVVDYAVASGVFNIRLNASYDNWTSYVTSCLSFLNEHTRRGFSANFLTHYSDQDRMEARPDLYFANPCYIFDYCKRHFSRNVALLHDYDLYDFTIVVRKHDS